MVGNITNQVQPAKQTYTTVTGQVRIFLPYIIGSEKLTFKHNILGKDFSSTATSLTLCSAYLGLVW